MTITKGIYDSKTSYSVKVTLVTKRFGKNYAELHFTNNPNHRGTVGLEGKHLSSFMKNYYKRK